jgi:F-type H+-transporting ATPase subunit b
MLRKLGKLLWIATTPLALTLTMATVSAQSHGGSHGNPLDKDVTQPGLENQAEHGEHHFVTNPIENFSSFSYRGKDNHGGVMGDEIGPEHAMPGPFSMALVNFAVFAFLLGKYAGPAIGRYTRERHTGIAKALDEGTRLRDEARGKLEEYSRKLETLQTEIDKLVSGIRADAEQEKTRIIADAEARASRMTRDAELQIQAEMQRVRMTLEREAVVAAVAIAEKLLREKATEADQKALADKFVKSLDGLASQPPV